MDRVAGKLFGGKNIVLHHIAYDIRVAYHRKLVTETHENMTALRGRAVSLRHIKKHDRRLAFGKQYLAHEIVIRFFVKHGISVVDGIFHKDKIGLMVKHVFLYSVNSEVRIRSSYSGVYELKITVRECCFPPFKKYVRIAFSETDFGILLSV